MKKRFKQVYIEITNICNLDCSFCPKTKRALDMMSLSSFQQIIDRVYLDTDLIYLHVMGEPLLHPDLIEMIQYVNSKGLPVAITTNGVLLPEFASMITDVNIKRINISLHSYIDKNNKTTSQQLNNTIIAAEEILGKIKTTIFYRVWDIKNKNAQALVEQLLEHYHVEPQLELITDPNGIAIKKRVRLQQENQFEWPINGENNTTSGFCQGLRNQLAILVDGTVVPCCLDSEGMINLGNIYQQDLDSIISSSIASAIYNGFSERKITHPLCQRCEYRNRFGK